MGVGAGAWASMTVTDAVAVVVNPPLVAVFVAVIVTVYVIPRLFGVIVKYLLFGV